MIGRALAAPQATLVFSALLAGQTFRGGISGTVFDQSGATVANATVKLTGTDTGLARTSATGDAGQFTFQDLPLGRYSVNITQAGFQSQDITDINIEAGKIFNLQAKLAVASQATSVEVSAASVAVETSSSAFDECDPNQSDSRCAAERPRFYATAKAQSGHKRRRVGKRHAYQFDQLANRWRR